MKQLCRFDVLIIETKTHDMSTKTETTVKFIPQWRMKGQAKYQQCMTFDTLEEAKRCMNEPVVLIDKGYDVQYVKVTTITAREII